MLHSVVGKSHATQLVVLHAKTKRTRGTKRFAVVRGQPMGYTNACDRPGICHGNIHAGSLSASDNFGDMDASFERAERGS